MNHFTRFGFSMALMLVLGCCATARERRITNNPKIYQDLSTSDQVLVQQGRIREGMSKEAVFLAYGRPDGVATGRQGGKEVEVWSYMDSQPVYANTYSVGLGWGRGAYGWGRYGGGYYGAWDPFWSYSPSVVYVPYRAATVTFRGNRVTEFMNGPQ